MRNWLIAGLVMFLISPAIRAADEPTDVQPGEIAGTVTNDDGKPLEGALVDAWTWYTGDEIKTDKDGHFYLKKLYKDQPIELRISKDGFSPWYNPQQPSGVADLNVSLNSKTFFEGLVLSPDGKPQPNVLVRADSGPKQGKQVRITNVWTETKSDADGHYLLYVAPDSYRIEARVPDVGIATVRADVGNDEGKNQNIQLEQGVRFVVKCIDADTDQPVPNVKVTVERHKGMQAVSDKNGEAVLENLPADKVEVELSSKPHVRAWSADATNAARQKRPENLNLTWEAFEFALSADMKPVTVNFEKGIVASGHVYDPEGNPVAGAIVVTNKVGWGDSIDMTQRFTAHTKEDGSFSLVLPSSGEDSLNLIAHDGDYGKWRKWANGVAEPIQPNPGDTLDNITIKLTTPATIRGKVVDASGNPIADKPVRVMSVDALDSRYVAPEAKTDKDGNYEIKFVRPGDVLVQADPFYMRTDNGTTPAISSTETHVAENEVKEGVDVTAKQP